MNVQPRESTKKKESNIGDTFMHRYIAAWSIAVKDRIEIRRESGATDGTGDLF
jgi:hypothetical protein